jgi:transcriptional regulator with XRE-family HTH domain
MPALGEEFRSAREARGLSLSDVAERLHIRSVYLAAIEDEDWKAIGAPVYIRGFMRTYARFLGLDAEAAVARFAATAPSPAPAAPSRAIEERSRESGGDATRPSAFAILAVVVAVAVVAYVAYAYVQYRSSGAVPVAAASPGELGDAPVTDGSPPADAADAVPTPAPAVVRAKAAALKRGLRLKLTETSWLRVAIDGTVVAEGTFPAGTTKSYRGKLADVRVGNAGGVSIVVNGRPVGKLGNDGDVAERQFVLSGE